jgi:hypothetical protein
MSAVLPDPLEFAADALSAAGALVDRDAEGWWAVLPPELARELGAGEECRLAARAPELPRTDVLACGIGAPALERLATRQEGAAPWAAARLDAEPPRARHARALAERFAVRNAPTEAGDATPSLATYLMIWFAWSAEGDDRYDGVLQTSVCLDDLGVPDPGLVALADPLRQPSLLGPAGGGSGPSGLRRALSLAAARTERGLEAPLAELRALVARRLHRDHERIAEYFEQLARDTRASRRRVDRAAIEAKLDHLRAERDAKLRALAERYRLRVGLAPIALLQIEVPTLCVRVRVRRRKREGELRLRLAPGAAGLDQLACAACPGTTASPVVCDDHLHVLCESCAPSAQGRPTCGACRQPGGERDTKGRGASGAPAEPTADLRPTPGTSP